jgi:hypothetical protein
MESFFLSVEKDCLSVDTRNRCNVPNDNIIRAAEASFHSHRVSIQTTHTQMPILYVIPNISSQTPSKLAANTTTISNLLRSEEFQMNNRTLSPTTIQTQATARRNRNRNVIPDDDEEEEVDESSVARRMFSPDDRSRGGDNIIDDDGPSPADLQRRAQELGIDIDLFNSFPDDVSRQQYLEAVSSGLSEMDLEAIQMALMVAG